VTAFKLGTHEPPEGTGVDAELEAELKLEVEAELELEVEAELELEFFGTALLTRCAFFSLSPVQFIQHPRAFIDSSMNQTLNRKIPIKIRGTTKVAIVIEGPTIKQSNHNNPVTQTPMIPCCGSEE